MNWWCLRKRWIGSIFLCPFDRKLSFTHQWMYRDRLDSIWSHPMRSLALLCDGTCAKMTIDDLFYVKQRTPCPAVRIFLPENICIRREPPAILSMCVVNVFGLYHICVSATDAMMMMTVWYLRAYHPDQLMCSLVDSANCNASSRHLPYPIPRERRKKNM